jgi:predicted RNA-binding Zn-ribbon protein involved in translation (DUF1610 family)
MDQSTLVVVDEWQCPKCDSTNYTPREEWDRPATQAECDDCGFEKIHTLTEPTPYANL